MLRCNLFPPLTLVSYYITARAAEVEEAVEEAQGAAAAVARADAVRADAVPGMDTTASRMGSFDTRKDNLNTRKDNLNIRMDSFDIRMDRSHRLR